MDKDEAYLVGYTKGDGCLYFRRRVFTIDPTKILGAYEVVWGDKDVEQLSIIRKIISRRFPEKWMKIKERKQSAGKILCTYRKIVFEYVRNLLESLDIESDPQLIAAFISGFCDAEADVGKTLNIQKNNKQYMKPRIQITQKDRTMLEKIQNLLNQHFSIKSSIYKKWRQNAYVLQLNSYKQVSAFQSHINFRNPTKRSKLAKLVKSSPSTVSRCSGDTVWS